MIRKRCMVVFQALILHAVAIGQTADVPDYGFEWALIDDPGNRKFDRPELWDQRLVHDGSVDHIYRITKTKITNTQWLEFLHVFAQYSSESLIDSDLIGRAIRYDGTGPDGEHRFSVEPAKAEHAVRISWFNAARYCNWLHNGRGSEPGDFIDGAYDTRDAMLFEDRLTGELFSRRPGARFWIPSDNEWVKAMYWDPDHPNFSDGGYWYYPHGKDVPAISDLPENGGETNAGSAMFELVPFSEYDPYLLVGLYSNTLSPFGLLDGSGNGAEWAEFNNNSSRGSARIRGTDGFFPIHEYFDAIDTRTGRPIVFGAAFRLASIARCTSDFVPPFGVFDLSDIVAFIDAFLDQREEADLAEPFQIWNIEDVSVFVDSFLASRCNG